MTSQPSITADDLLGLVAGVLNHQDFVRIAKAVKNDAALQAQLANFERIRIELDHAIVFDRSQSTAGSFAENLAKRVAPIRIDTENTKPRRTWTGWLHRIYTVSSMPARIAYSLVAVQAVGIAWLVSGAVQFNDGSTASSRTAAPDAKQLGSAPASVTFSVSFDPATPESTVRGLLLELEAQIIAGPSQLGQYKIVVARNRSHLALFKLREAIFVEQATELAKEADKKTDLDRPDAKDGEKK